MWYTHPVQTQLDGSSVKALALSAGCDLVRVAPAGAAKDPPPWTRSILVTGLAALDPAFDYQIFVTYGGRRRWHKFAYEILMTLGHRAAAALRDLGYRAEPLLYDDSIRIIDLKLAAETAGMGSRGLNGLLITPEFGPRIRLGAIFTDLELPADTPRDGYPCSSCTRCWSACPTRALGPDGLDRSLCLAEFAPDAAMIERQKAALRHLTPHTRQQCTLCVTSCPIGKAATETFYVA
jgi:epoxyqueuosine reductase